MFDVKVSPKTGLPEIVTVPFNSARDTVIVTFLMKGVVGVKPLTIVAVIVAVPAAVVFKILPLVMLAPVVPAFSTLHTIVWLVALFGTTVPIKVRGSVAVADVGIPVISVTGICSGDVVDNVATGLSGDARCVGVSASRCLKLYAVLGVNPVKVVDDCQAPPLMLYSHPVTVVSVIVVLVADAKVGAEGAA